MALEFLDTNVLVYAYDATAGLKHERAKDVIWSLTSKGVAAISVQTMQEFFVTVTRKIPVPISVDDAIGRLEAFSRWRVYAPLPTDVIEAARLSQQYHLSMWDAMIVLAAYRTGATKLWTEDLNDGQVINGVTIVNPFYAVAAG